MCSMWKQGYSKGIGTLNWHVGNILALSRFDARKPVTHPDTDHANYNVLSF